MIRDANKCECEIYFAWLKQGHSGGRTINLVKRYKLRIVYGHNVSQRSNYELRFTELQMNQMREEVRIGRWK